MEKLLTVCQVPQGKKYTAGVNIKGEYLKKFGFAVGDFVKVTVSNNKIIIEKNASTEILTHMGAKNQAIFQMIEQLGLTV
ncbi:MAG: SymE family type I addiction module toxin [Bacteroidales bacterium]|nr:SymE family type I addiction module toxin [Bacteroidales bacterium]